MNNKLCIALLSFGFIAQCSQPSSKAPSRTISNANTPRTRVISNASTPRTEPYQVATTTTPRPSNPLGRELLFGIAAQPEFRNQHVGLRNQHSAGIRNQYVGLRGQYIARRNQEQRNDLNTQPVRGRRAYPAALPVNRNREIETFIATLPPAATQVQRPNTYLDVARRNQ